MMMDGIKDSYAKVGKTVKHLTILISKQSLQHSRLGLSNIAQLFFQYQVT